MGPLQPEPGTTESGRSPWLQIDQSRDETVDLVVIGGIVGERAEELWASVEYALEVAADRLVRLDLTQAVGFDVSTMGVLRNVVRTASRRCDNLEIVIRTGSPIQQYGDGYGLSPDPQPSLENDRGRLVAQRRRLPVASRELVHFV